MGRIKANKPLSKAHVVAQPPSSVPTLTFSFKHIELDNAKFCFDACEPRDFVKALERLRSVSTLTKIELIHDRSPSLRSHEIEWGATTEPEGFAHLHEQLRSCTPWQFSISSNEYGRVHGFWIADVFFIVWFDFSHELFA